MSSLSSVHAQLQIGVQSETVGLCALNTLTVVNKGITILNGAVKYVSQGGTFACIDRPRWGGAEALHRQVVVWKVDRGVRCDRRASHAGW